MERLREAIAIMIMENNGYLDDYEAAIASAYNAMVPADQRLEFDEG